MNATDGLGYLAALLVLAAFSMRDMVALRVLAIASNLAFVAYAALVQIHPVLLLHALLLPMNAWRLLAALRGRGRSAPPRCVETCALRPMPKEDGRERRARASTPGSSGKAIARLDAIGGARRSDSLTAARRRHRDWHGCVRSGHRPEPCGDAGR